MNQNTNTETTFSDDLPGTSYEEGGYKRVRQIHGVLADAIRAKFSAEEDDAVVITEYQMYGAMFEPETDDECDLIITCGEHSKGFASTSTKTNLANLAQWAVLPD